MITGVGVDIIEVERIKKAVQNKRFLNRIFTKNEIKEQEKSKIRYQRLATRFAAKEAIKKALNIPLIWKEIEIMRDKNGKPKVNFYNETKKLVKDKKVLVSLSHTKKYAIAFVIAMDNS